jgi:hypothetical protein
MSSPLTTWFGFFSLMIACGGSTTDNPPGTGSGGSAGTAGTSSGGSAGTTGQGTTIGTTTGPSTTTGPGTTTVGGAGGSGGSAGGGAGGSAGGGGSDCALAPKGTKFTFHVHNPGTTTLTLFLGCSRSIPIVLDTPDGKLSIGPGSVDVCEFTCDQVYARQVTPGGCSDCGPGYSKTIAPGMSADIEWERLVYVRHPVDSSCANGTGTCALGVPVAASKMQTGVVTACASPNPTFSCAQPKMVNFTIDTTASDGTIELM